MIPDARPSEIVFNMGDFLRIVKINSAPMVVKRHGSVKQRVSARVEFNFFAPFFFGFGVNGVKSMECFKKIL